MPPRSTPALRRGRPSLAVAVDVAAAAAAPSDLEPTSAAVAASSAVALVDVAPTPAAVVPVDAIVPVELAPAPAAFVAVRAVAHDALVPTAIAVAAVDAAVGATVAAGMPPGDVAAIDAGAVAATVVDVMPSDDVAGIGASAAGTPQSVSPGDVAVPWASHVDVASAAPSAAVPPGVGLPTVAGHGGSVVAVAAAPHTASGRDHSSITACAGQCDTADAVAVASPPDDQPVPRLYTTPMIKKAAAFRIKYRKQGSPFRLPPDNVGFHPFNRDGQPPNGLRCLDLCKDILNIGYDTGEADTGGIAVEEKPGHTRLHDFNTQVCAKDPLLADVVGCISYGSLSHSHLHQILRNIKFGANCTGLPAVAGTDDCFSLDLLRSVDPAFAHAAVTGLNWEVLGVADRRRRTPGVQNHTSSDERQKRALLAAARNASSCQHRDDVGKLRGCGSTLVGRRCENTPSHNVTRVCN